MGKYAKTRHYVYGLSVGETDAGMFYIGKGTGERIDGHISEARSRHLCPKCAILRWGAPRNCIHYHILHETDDEAHALWLEMREITAYPYGALCNLLGGPRPPVILKWDQLAGGRWQGWLHILEDDGAYDIYKDHIAPTQQDVQWYLAPAYDELVLKFYLPLIGRGFSA